VTRALRFAIPISGVLWGVIGLAVRAIGQECGAIGHQQQTAASLSASGFVIA
jgi:hypothetical protein